MKTSRQALRHIVALVAAAVGLPLTAADAKPEVPTLRAGVVVVAGQSESWTAEILGDGRARNGAQQFREVPGRVYETVEEIKAMTRCKATVVDRVPCSVYLRTTGTNGFYIGSPGSKADVAHFVGFLKDGETYIFPDVFLEYLKKRRGTRE